MADSEAMTFDDLLSELLALNGSAVVVHVLALPADRKLLIATLDGEMRSNAPLSVPGTDEEVAGFKVGTGWFTLLEDEVKRAWRDDDDTLAIETSYAFYMVFSQAGG